jgi:hypothetical protein
MGYPAEKETEYGRLCVRVQFDTDIARAASERNYGVNNGRVV